MFSEKIEKEFTL